MRTDPIPARPDYGARSEAALIGLARGGDNGAVRELIRRCNQQLFRIARSILHNDAEAEDAVQAAYMAGFSKLDSFRGEAAFATWLTRITMNEAYSRLRRRDPVVNLSDWRETQSTLDGGISGPMTSPQINPESELARAQVRRLLEAAIEALPEHFRLAYVMRDVQEMTTREVADVLGVNIVTVKTRLFRARRLLRLELQKNIAGGFSGIFPFAGTRCAGMADRVVQALARRPED